MKYTPGQGVTVFKESTNHANGLTRDLQGRLVACEQDTRARWQYHGDRQQLPGPPPQSAE
jgi:sugar lactone lactonase YvrE